MEEVRTMTKPPSCKPCPSYTLSKTYTPDTYRPVPVLVLGEVDECYLRLASLTPETISHALPVRCAGEHTQEALEYCHRMHYTPPQETQLVIAVGGQAAKLVGLEGKLGDWRGHVHTQD